MRNCLRRSGARARARARTAGEQGEEVRSVGGGGRAAIQGGRCSGVVLVRWVSEERVECGVLRESGDSGVDDCFRLGHPGQLFATSTPTLEQASNLVSIYRVGCYNKTQTMPWSLTRPGQILAPAQRQKSRESAVCLQQSHHGRHVSVVSFSHKDKLLRLKPSDGADFCSFNCASFLSAHATYDDGTARCFCLWSAVVSRQWHRGPKRWPGQTSSRPLILATCPGMQSFECRIVLWSGCLAWGEDYDVGRRA
ncbi:hypothetical protein BKA81DRAFT_54467 [Phyllosticta paracitricarpa]|uniref:Uncharacterized protein n=2 Tax=Phyllosticta TaxID=121621 RepID=A0ABR1MLW9_9PEZI